MVKPVKISPRGKKKLTESNKRQQETESVVTKLGHEYITLIAQLNRELVRQQIITPTQKTQIEEYILKQRQ